MRDNKSSHRNTDMDEEAGDGGSEDVFEMLKSDHRRVEELFSRFEDADKRTRTEIANETLQALEIHTTIEEELVYPAIREVLDEKEQVDEALEEHHVAKLLIKELRKMNPGTEEFAPKFKVLGEIVQHHAEEEENEMFPKAEAGDIDTTELSEEVAQRKEKLMQKYEGKKSPGQSKRRKAA
jgi:hemerythrin superfamily protein